MSEEAARDFPEEVSHAFYTMNGFEPIIDRIAEDDREGLISSLGAIFDINGPSDTSDAKMKQFFVFCRLKLDAFKDQKEKTDSFRDMVVAAVDGFKPAITSDIPDPFSAAAAAPAAAEERADKSAPLDRVLFPELEDQEFDLPDNYTALLFPCPEGTEQMTSWLSGEPFSADAIAIGFGKLSLREEERMAEAEAELHAGPQDYLRRNGIRKALNTDHDAQAWLITAGEMCGDLPSEEDSLIALKAATAQALRAISPSAAEDLGKLGARLNYGKDVLNMVGATLSLEAGFLQGLEAEEERDEQIPLGAPHPHKALMPGQTLTRAVVIHAFSGISMPEALAESLAELRFVQTLRECDLTSTSPNTENFDKLFFEDCFSPLEQYSLAKKEEMEPAL